LINTSGLPDDTAKAGGKGEEKKEEKKDDKEP